MNIFIHYLAFSGSGQVSRKSIRDCALCLFFEKRLFVDNGPVQSKASFPFCSVGRELASRELERGSRECRPSLGVLRGAGGDGGDGGPDAGILTRRATALPAQLGNIFPALSINWKACWAHADRGWGPPGVLVPPPAPAGQSCECGGVCRVRGIAGSQSRGPVLP